MVAMSNHPHAHDHIFGQDQRRPGETRTLAVFALTLITMAVEITAGVMTGSMALLADGLHMGSHALALGITPLRTGMRDATPTTLHLALARVK